MRNILVTVRVCLAKWSGKTAVIICDNQAVVSVRKYRQNRNYDTCSYGLKYRNGSWNLQVIHEKGRAILWVIVCQDGTQLNRLKIVPSVNWKIPEAVYFILLIVFKIFSRYGCKG